MPETTTLKTNCSPTWVSSVAEDKSKTLFASFIIILSQVYRESSKGYMQISGPYVRINSLTLQQTLKRPAIRETMQVFPLSCVCVWGGGSRGVIICNILLTYNGFIMFQWMDAYLNSSQFVTSNTAKIPNTDITHINKAF